MTPEKSTDDIRFTGGSRVGWVNASWPLAQLRCRRDRLTLKSLGTCEFTPDQVVAFDIYGSIPLLANGLAIVHNRLDYPARVVFWCMGSRQRVLEQIRDTGFVPTGVAIERPGGMAFRWSFVIACVLLWNLAFFVGGNGLAFDTDKGTAPKPSTILVVAALFALATAIRWWPRLQRIALAPGHTVAEVRQLLLLLQIVSAFLVLVFGALALEAGV